VQPKISRNFLFCIVLPAYLLSSCATPSSQQGHTPQVTQPLTEYFGPNPTATVQAVGTLVGAVATPTPLIYTVVANDTFFGIAVSFNVSLEALIAANPGLDPRALAPGTEILIPSGVEVAQSAALPTTTPVVTEASAPVCYATAANELWCFVVVKNSGSQLLENVTGVVRLLSAGGDLLAELEAVPPLDIVPAGAELPLVAYTNLAPSNWAAAQAQILTAFHLAAKDEHYVEVNSIDFQQTYNEENTAVHVQGSVSVQGSADLVWILAVAYDSQGKVVGVRRWESAGEVSFDIWVYSLGSQIADVRVLAEARP
jgi:LysM repeat protein